MGNNEITQNICLGLFGVAVYIGFLVMFTWGAWKGDFIFHGGRIRGKLARIIGIIGLIGMTAGTYLLVSIFIFKTTPPLASFAGLLFGLTVVMVLVVRFLSVFMWHQK